MNKLLRYTTQLAGWGAIAWVAAGYGAANPLALAVTGLIGAVYLMGALELHRFQQATTALAQAIDALAQPLTSLPTWLAGVPAALRNAVRRRIEGEPVGLPGPAMATSLAGLLVLLGMLGTFLGMVLTLRGTGAALDSATDLVAVRNALVAPVKGLGVAFGTSIAGVAASAALGLLAALCRRERLRVTQTLDACIATSLREHSADHQRAHQRAHYGDATLGLLQRQAEQMPALIDGLRALMQTIEQQAEASQTRLLASQERFHGQAEAAYAGLASSIDRTLQASLADSARIAGEQVQAVATSTLAGIARDTAALHSALAGTMQAQLDQLSARFEASSATVAEAWHTGLARHERTGEALAEGVRASHDQFAATFAQRSAALVGDVATRLEATLQHVREGWGAALAEQARVSEQVSHGAAQSLAAAAASFEQQASALLRDVRQAQAEGQSASAARDEQRAATLTQTLAAMAASLQHEWQAASAQTLAGQQQVCDTMARTAGEIMARADAQARHTGAEISRLVQAAAEAPRAAADVIAELREKLSDSMTRDNTLLAERAHLLGTLGTLLDGINHAATEQRGAIEALVASSAAVLEGVGSRFSAQVEAEAGKLADVAAQVTGSAVEVASLGEAFGHAVQLFGASSDQLGAHLQRIDGTLSAVVSRSDEQLAYYVAQAREVIDLSILSQKQIIQDLQRLASRPAEAQAVAP